MTLYGMMSAMRRVGAALALIAGASIVHAQRDFGGGALFTMSNAAAGNELIMFRRDAGGMLTPGAVVATGGEGTGAGLGNQGGLILTHGGRVGYVVNAGSGTVSVFWMGHHGPVRIQEVDADGDRPLSLTHHGRLVYVLNADGAASGADHINGFVVGPFGRLHPLANSTRALSAGNTGPAQIGFSPNGRTLVVTEKMTNTIDVFKMGPYARPGNAMPQASEGQTPFGFGFTAQGRLVVSEAFGGAPDASAVSSYSISGSGALNTISASVPTGETAACWIARTVNSKFVYATNTGSNSVSGLKVGNNGSLTALTPGAPTASTGMGPIDAAVVGNKYLYVLSGGSGEINSFRIGNDGSLTPLQTITGLPLSANGLAAK